MKILLISDTHNKHNQILTKYLENKDGLFSMIIHAGDVSGRGYKNEITSFLEWYSKLPFEHKVMIPGNHDFLFEDDPKSSKELLDKYPNITYLQDSGVEINGVKIWGSGITPYFFNWAFNRIGDAICKHWELIPLDTQILITHGPVKGILDVTKRNGSVGCPYLLEKIQQLPELKLHVCGHIHEAYGMVINNKITFVNASVLDLNYNMAHEPIQVEI